MEEARRAKKEAKRKEAEKVKKMNIFKSMPDKKPDFVANIQKRINSTAETKAEAHTDSLLRKGILLAQFKREQGFHNSECFVNQQKDNSKAREDLAQSEDLCAILFKAAQGKDKTTQNPAMMAQPKILPFKGPSRK